MEEPFHKKKKKFVYLDKYEAYLEQSQKDFKNIKSQIFFLKIGLGLIVITFATLLRIFIR
jgi:hypothetical protein